MFPLLRSVCTVFFYFLLIKNGVWSYKPVVILHGILDDGASMNDLKSMIVEAHPGTNVSIIDLFDEIKSILTPMWTQTSVVGEAVKQLMQVSKDGIHLIGYSQGGLLGRAIIENCSDHNIHTFVSISSPQMGQYGVTSVIAKFLPRIAREFLYIWLYKEEFQEYISIANYWKDPKRNVEYLNGSVFLPFVNNNNNSKFADKQIYAHQKSNFAKLQNLVLIGGPDDGVITPWQSALFAFYDENLNVVSMEKQEVYVDDWFGLGTLGKRNAIHPYVFGNIEHTKWHGSHVVFQKAIEPWLT